MRILFVAIPSSVHVMRWISQLADQNWDVHLFPAYPSYLHEGFRDLTVYGLSSLRQTGSHPSVRFRGLLPIRRGVNRIEWAIHRRRPNLEARLLATLVRILRPDVIHSLEFQHAAYLTHSAREMASSEFPAWIVSNWGSDIFLFGRLENHKERIRRILDTCDFYAAECQRDIDVALGMGLKGEVLSVLPNGGGYPIADLAKHRKDGPTSRRRVIALKGYQGWAGRALFGLRALEMCAESLSGYEIVIYSASDDVEMAAELLSGSSNLSITVMPRSSHVELLKLHGRARVSIGLSIGDGISTSLLDAMVMGSFPIQSHTSCANEWIEPGETGFLVHPEDPEEIAASIREALSRDEFVDRATGANDQTIRQRLDARVIQPKVVKLYESVARESAAVDS